MALPPLEEVRQGCTNARLLASICDFLEGGADYPTLAHMQATRALAYERRIHDEPRDGSFIMPEEEDDA